ncbi:MAG: hypothetical protein JRE64_07335 [Deltaproteobacteria bacterium]|nr:hypothetical protein [Deltaproteobacteria bacterium]
MSAKILGISAYYHDSAAALLADGKIVAAAQEERFTRRKHYAGFPENTIRHCLEHARIMLSDVDYIGKLLFERDFLELKKLML